MVKTLHNMIFTIEQKKEAYKKLPVEVQSFIMDPETNEIIEVSLQEAGLNETQLTEAYSEILYSMYGLQTLAETMANIAKLSNKNINDLTKLRTNLEDNIFSKIKNTNNIYSPETNAEPQNLKLDKATDDVIGEIVKKYSLNDIQHLKLMNIAVSNATNPKDDGSLLETMMSELNISRLLAEQVVYDLKNRILEKKSPSPTVTKSPLSRFETVKPPVHAQERTLEIRPESLPAIEKESEDLNKIGVPRYVPTNTYKPASAVINNPARVNSAPINTPIPPKTTPAVTPIPAPTHTITYRPKSNVPEQVQQVTSVPRFTISTEKKVENKPVTPPSPMENKMNNVTANTLEKSVADMLPPKHNVDPYREPLN
jgi:hypothetical protein